MANVTKSIEIEASPEKVFAWMSDIKNANDSSKGFTELTQTSTGPLALGSTMHVVGKAGGQTVEVDMEATEFVKNKKIVWSTVGASKTKMTSTWTYEPTAKGTKVTYSQEYEVPYSILGKLVDKLKVHKGIEENNSKQLEYIKKALEA
jgi:coenzyme Q-binding protein COQ10